MQRQYLITALIALLPFMSGAQSKWGIEFKGSRFNTTNSGQLKNQDYTTILEETDLVTNSLTLGVIYRLNDRNLLKFHQGFHKNGSTVTLRTCTDIYGDCHTDTNVMAVQYYFQLAPSYTYRLVNKRIIIPVEVGININVRRNLPKTFYPCVKSFNYDFEISTGIDYRILPNMILGIHGLFTGYISEYHSIYERGTFKPYSWGFEFSMMYEFGKNIDVY